MFDIITLYIYQPADDGGARSSWLFPFFQVSDMLFILLCVPFTAADYALTSVWPFGDLWCSSVQYLIIVTVLGSIYTLVLMSLDRWELRQSCRRKQALMGSCVLLSFSWGWADIHLLSYLGGAEWQVLDPWQNLFDMFVTRHISLVRKLNCNLLGTVLPRQVKTIPLCLYGRITILNTSLCLRFLAVVFPIQSITLR